MKNELGDKCFCDSFAIVEEGHFIAEVDGCSFDNLEYDSMVEFIQAIIDRVYDCAMGNLN